MSDSTIQLSIPSSANGGSSVAWSAVINNVSADDQQFACQIWVNHVQVGSDQLATIPAGFSQTFSGTFTMPTVSSEVAAYSLVSIGYYPEYEGDSSDYKTIIETGTNSFTVSCSTSGNGQITAGPTVPTSYQSGTQLTVSCIAEPNYSFIGWYENGSLVWSSESYTFTVVASRTLVAEFSYATIATLTMIPNPVQQGRISMVSVSGFAHGGLVTFTLLNGDNTSTGTYWTQRLDSTGAGAFGLTFGNNPGTYILQASDGVTITTKIMVISAGPTVTISPLSVVVGGTTTVTVQNFTPSTPLTISINPGTETVSGTTTTDINGNASFSVVVNGSNIGPYQLTVSDSLNTRVVTITITQSSTASYSSLVITSVLAQAGAPLSINSLSFSFI